MKRRIARIWDRYRRTPRGLRWVAIPTIVIAVVWIEEDVRGRWALHDLHRRAEAMGISLRWEDVELPEPAEEDDVLAAPIFAEWFAAPNRDLTRLNGLDLRQIAGLVIFNENDPYLGKPVGAGIGWLGPLGSKLDPMGDFYGADAQRVLDAVAPVNADLNAVGAAVRRPEIGVLYRDPLVDLRDATAFFEYTRRVVIVTRFRARARIQLGQAEESLSDALTMLKMARHCGEPHLLILGSMMQDANQAIGEDAIFQGIKERIWSADQLSRLQTELNLHDFVQRYPQMLQQDAAARIEVWLTVAEDRSHVAGEAPFRSFWSEVKSDPAHFHSQAILLGKRIGLWTLPSGAYHQYVYRMNAPILDAMITPGGRLSQRLEIAQVDALRALGEKRTWSPYAIGFAAEYEIRAARSAENLLGAQQRLDLMQIAVALERYFLDNERYPDDLGEITPKYTTEITPDRFNPTTEVRYALTPNGRYKLWASGFDRKDDGGDPGRKNGKAEGEDVVWQYTERPPILPTSP